MARGKQPQTPKVSRVWVNAAEIDAAVSVLHKRISDLKEFADQTHKEGAEATAISTRVKNSLRDILGADSPEFESYEHFTVWPGSYFSGTDFQDEFREGAKDGIIKLKYLIQELEEKKEHLAVRTASEPGPQKVSGGTRSNKVFIVHGHDDALKEKAARLISQLKLEPIILHEQPNKGQTIIDKFESNSEMVGFAIILLTPDDEGYPKGKPDMAQGRARQNVVFELGYFVGKLGRPNVCALRTGSTEIPSDLHGILYVPVDTGGLWKFAVAKELVAAGYAIDLNNVPT